LGALRGRKRGEVQKREDDKDNRHKCRGRRIKTDKELMEKRKKG